MPQGIPNRRPSYRGTFPSGDPRWQRLRKGVSGGPVTPLPSVATVGVNGIGINASLGTAFATVIGSINPSGQTTNWWVTYGTSLPLPGPLTTAVALVGNGTTPVTVTAELTGLTVGATYYVAVVGQSVAGTVSGAIVSFVAQVTTPASLPIVPFGQSSVNLPHFNLPFMMISKNGVPQGIQVVEQDTTEEVLACVTAIVDCPVGAIPQLPSFGIPTPTFNIAPLDPSEIIAAIERIEPRATETATSQLLADGVTWGLDLTTSTASGPQLN